MPKKYADGFTNYVKSLGQSIRWRSATNLILELGAPTANGCRLMIKRQLKDGTIDLEKAEVLNNALDSIVAAREAGTGTHAADVRSGGWAELGNGGHMRKTILAGG